MKASQAQRLVTLSDAREGMPDLVAALKAKRATGYDRVALLIGIHQISSDGDEEVSSIEIDLETADSIVEQISNTIERELSALGFEAE